MHRRNAMAAALMAAGGLWACGDDVDPLPQPIIQFAMAPMSDCPDGGQLVLTGIDLDENGVLEGNEIGSSTPVCTGGAGEQGEQGLPGTNALLRTVDEPAGANCDNGGLRIEVGADDDGDGSLAEGEVDQTTFACDGAPGAAGRRTLSRIDETPPAGCVGDGFTIEFGLDLNENGMLDDMEVQSSESLCDGEVGLSQIVSTEVEPAGPNCPVGGIRLDVGIDENEDGVLSEDELDRTEYVCDPVNALVRTGPDTSGQCPNTGTRIESGLDANGDGILQPGEVQQSSTTCAGADGAQILVTTQPEAPGTNCPDGGQQVRFGSDQNGDGVLQPAEVSTTRFICSGADGADGSGGSLVLVSAEPAGSNCADGGTRIDVGPDGDDDGVLDPDEIVSTSYSCDGAATASLVEVNEEPAGVNCADGGVRIESGVDDDGDGVLDPGEIDDTSFVCDAPGTSVPFSIITAALPDDFSTLPYEADITAAGGTGGSYSWAVTSGSLPPGLTLDASGTPSTTLSGTPTMNGTFNFTVEVTDFFGQTASQALSVTFTAPPCSRGTGGLVGTTSTMLVVDSTFPSNVTGLATDTSTSGYVYWVNDGSGFSTNGDLERFDKVTGVSEDVAALVPGLNLPDIGQIHVDATGDDIYLTSADSSCTTDCVWRISSDGGQTFTLDALGDFTTLSPNDDFNGIVEYDGTIFVITDDFTEAELYSMPASASSTTVPTLLGSFQDLGDCQGLAADDDYIYTLCDDDSGGVTEGIVRIDRTTFGFEIQEFDLGFITGSTGGQIYADDTDADGLADFLYAQGDSGNQHYVCDPTGALPWFSGALGGDGDDEGLAYDAANQVIWQIDESTDDAYSLQ